MTAATPGREMLELAGKIVDATFNTPTCRKLKGDKREMVVAILADELANALARLSAPVPPADGAISDEQIADALGKAFAELDDDQRSHNDYVLAGLQAVRRLISPSGTGAAEAVSDERALALAHKICVGELSAVQGAVEIMQYATDGVLQMQAATPPVRGDREAMLAAIKRELVSPTDTRSLYTAKPLDERIADAILSLPVQPGAGEREATIEECAAKCVAPLTDQQREQATKGIGAIMTFEETWNLAQRTSQAAIRALFSRQAPHSGDGEGR
jgi:hypothetical protein